MKRIVHALTASMFLVLGLSAMASDLPNDVASVNYGTPREVVALFGADGHCAIKVREGWVAFSKDRDANIHQAMDLGVSEVLKQPRQVARLYGVVVTVGLQDAEHDGRVDVITLAPSRRHDGVPIFLADFVSRACVMGSDADIANLARVRELPVRVRKRVIQIMTIAALRRYHWDPSPTSAGIPFSWITTLGSRCGAAGLQCDLWAVSISPGFDGKWTP